MNMNVDEHNRRRMAAKRRKEAHKRRLSGSISFEIFTGGNGDNGETFARGRLFVAFVTFCSTQFGRAAALWSKVGRVIPNPPVFLRLFAPLCGHSSA